jgi:hypothetical protein
MKYKKIISTTILLLLLLDSRSQSQITLDKTSYTIDKKIEIDQRKFEFVDTGVLKRSMKIGVFWDDRLFFKNYDDDNALDCFTFSTITDDTISIVGYMIGGLGYGFNLKLIGDSCFVAPYALSDGLVYRLNPSDSTYWNLIQLPTTLHKVIISKKPSFKEGETIAGFVQLKSIPYYYKGLDGKFRIEVIAHFKTAPLKLIQ